MKHDQEIRSLFEPLPAPELRAPPGLDYADGIACYQLVVFFRGNADALEKRMPSGWTVGNVGSFGPAGLALKGANSFLSFHDAFIETKKKGSQTDPQGRFAIPAVIGKNDSTGERGPLSFTHFSADPANVPGKYKDKMLVKSISRGLSFRGDANTTKVSEDFEISSPDASDVTEDADVIAVTVRACYSRRVFNRLSWRAGAVCSCSYHILCARVCDRYRAEAMKPR